MSVQTANSQFKFQLPSLSYVDAKWEEPNLRITKDTAFPVRKTGVAGWFARRIEAYRAWQRNQQAIAELGMMSDHELVDIGISRSDMHRVFDPSFNEDLRKRGQAG
jgi:uncharacterized protein YjiS (DUF1127 family)